MALRFLSERTARPTTGKWSWAKRALTLVGFLAAIILTSLAFGQDISINFGDDSTITERAVQLVGLITLLSLAPSALVMVTSFTRIVVVL